MNAAAFIELVHKNQKRKTGESYTSHLYAVRDILRLAGISDPTVLTAALLHDVLEDSRLTRRYLAIWFGEEIANMVFYLSKSDKIAWNTFDARIKSHLTLMEEYWEEYPEIILIKMADRLHNLMTIEGFRPEKQKRYVEETQTILLPLFEKMYEKNHDQNFRTVFKKLAGQIQNELDAIQQRFRT